MLRRLQNIILLGKQHFDVHQRLSWHLISNNRYQKELTKINIVNEGLAE